MRRRHKDCVPSFYKYSSADRAFRASFHALRRNPLTACAAAGQNLRIEHPFERINDMFRQIIVNTPVWVWALLAFLIYRGMRAAVGQETKLKTIFIIPAIMLVLSLQGIATTFGMERTAAASWLLCMIAGTGLAWHLFRGDGIAVYPERGIIFQQGSWTPLMLMMGIFFTKYVVGVMLALDPSHKQQVLFASVVCASYGLFNGIFIGRVLRIVTMYRHKQMGMALPA